MSESELTKLVNGVEGLLEDMIVRDGSLLPVLISRGEQNAIMALDMYDKELLTEAIPAALKKTKSKMYVMVSECWTAELSAEDAVKLEYGEDVTPPSDRPDRKEFVMITGRDKETGESIFRGREIVRDYNGKVIALAPNKIPEGGKFDGRFADFYKEGDNG